MQGMKSCLLLPDGCRECFRETKYSTSRSLPENEPRKGRSGRTKPGSHKFRVGLPILFEERAAWT